MLRRSSLVLLLAKDPSKLFGAGRPRTAEQQKIFRLLKKTTIEKTFPHIAACWVGPCWGTVMQTPSNISPVCSKRAVWRCSQCLQEFEMGIAPFIDGGGICPHCHKPQKKVAKTDGKGGAAGAAAYAKAPRMVHTNYKSVLYANPEWEKLNIQPMLAQRWELVEGELKKRQQQQSSNSNSTGGGAAAGVDKDAQNLLLLASPKIDGIRCIIGYNARTDKVVFFSRGGIVLECCHGLEPHVRPLFKKDPTLMLDGELFAPECNFEQLNGLVRTKNIKPAMHAAQARLLEYFAFDIMYSSQLSSPAATFEERYALLKTIIPVCGAKRISNYFHTDQKKKLIRRNSKSATHNATLLAGTDEGDSGKTRLYHVPAARVLPEEMPDVLTEACSQGFEGVMIRRPEFPYEHGRRSFGLLKYKQMHDAEFEVVGFVAGEGKFEGGLGAFICTTKAGQHFHVPPAAPIATRMALWGRRRQLLGKFLTVQYQELSSQDVPRFPIAKGIRGSKDKSDWL